MSDRKRPRAAEPAPDPRKKFLQHLPATAAAAGLSGPTAAASADAPLAAAPAAAQSYPMPLPSDGMPVKLLKHKNRCLADLVDQLTETLRVKSEEVAASQASWSSQQRVLAALAQQWDQMDQDVTHILRSAVGSAAAEEGEAPLYPVLSKGVKSGEAAGAATALQRRAQRTTAIVNQLIDVVSRTKSEETATAEGGLAVGARTYQEQQVADLNKSKADLSARSEDLEKQQDRVAALEHEQQSLIQKNAALERRVEELKFAAKDAVVAVAPAPAAAGATQAASGPTAPTTSGQGEAAELRRELAVIEGQMGELNKRLSESRKHEAQLRMDNLSMEADKVKESSEYKHLYQVLQTERKQHSEERSSLRGQVDELWQKINAEGAEADALRAVESERRVQFGKILDGLKADIAKVMAERDEVQLALNIKSESSKNDQHSVELQNVIDTLRREQTTNCAEIKRLRKVMRDRILKSALAWEGDSQVIIDALKDETSRALKAEKDLKLLLNVHSNISKDRRDKVTISLSMQKAKDSLSELKSKISTGEIGGESELRKLLQQTADKLSTANTALKEKTATEEVLIQELESTGATLDEIQEQNGRLLKELKEKEAHKFELMAAKLAADQKSQLAQRSRAAGEGAVKAIELVVAKKNLQVQSMRDSDKALRDLLRNSDKRLRDTETQLEKSRQDLDQKATLHGGSSLQLQDLNAQLDKVKSDYVKSVTIRTTVEEQASKFERELLKSKSECQRLKTSASQSGGGADAKGMRKLVLDLNKRLKCTLCGDREKNAVISGAQGKGCMHVFCYECLENQIKDRNRKCPVCKHMFDKADIKRLYLDFGEK